jgi:hypothetical protein
MFASQFQQKSYEKPKTQESKIVQQNLLSGRIAPPTSENLIMPVVRKRPDIAKPTTQQACCVTVLASYQPTTPFPAQPTKPMNIRALGNLNGAVEEREKVSRPDAIARGVGFCFALFQTDPSHKLASYERLTGRSLDYRHCQSSCTLPSH